MKQQIEFVQEVLNQRSRNAGGADGKMGKNTRKALDTIIGLPKKWNDNRKVVGCIQLLAQEQQLEVNPIDGYWGPQTEHAFESLLELESKGSLPPKWRDSEAIAGNEVTAAKAQQWPLEKQSELIKFYGEVGTNQVYLKVPYPHVLAWDTGTKLTRFQCHEKVHDSLLRVLNNVLSHYGEHKIKALGLDLFAGCSNVRKIRGGSRYSTHSWGIAVDYDSARNKLRWKRDKAQFAKPEYEQWWKFWEEEGWVSLGRLKDYDWMHVQACRR